MYSTFQFTREIRNYWTAFIRFIYPSACVLCSSALDIDQNQLSFACLNKLHPLKKPLCEVCSAELPPFKPKPYRCNSCRTRKTYYRRGAALFPYGEDIKTILHQVKFEKKPWRLNILKPYFKNISTPLPLSQYNLIIPVPMDPHRRREREFNQSHLIAQLLTQGKHAPKVKNLLKKVRPTPPQSLLSRSERLINLADTFRLKRGVNIKDQSILMVDDIVTTGATIDECAKCLIQNGAKRVDFFSLAKAITS